MEVNSYYSTFHQNVKMKISVKDFDQGDDIAWLYKRFCTP